MNQEYLSQIVKRLLWLSNYLVSISDVKSDKCSELHISFLENRIREIYNLAPKARNQSDIGLLMLETYVDPWLYRQLGIANSIESDPFLPKAIRKKVAKTIADRTDKMTTAYCNVIERYCRDLYDGKIAEDYQEVDMRIRANIGDEYRKANWGWEDARKRFIDLRADIEKYLTLLR